MRKMILEIAMSAAEIGVLMAGAAAMLAAATVPI